MLKRHRNKEEKKLSSQDFALACSIYPKHESGTEQVDIIFKPQVELEDKCEHHL